MLSGASQQVIAERMGIDRDTYKNWEGTTEPDLATIKTIAAAIGIPPYRLLMDIIDFSGAVNDERPDQQYSFTLTAAEADKIRFSLGVLDLAFAPGPSSGRYKRQDIEDLKIEDNKKPRSSKSVKNKQKDNGR